MEGVDAQPANDGPDATRTPTRKDIGGVVYSQIDTTQANEQRKHDRDQHEVTLVMHAVYRMGQQGAEG